MEKVTFQSPNFLPQFMQHLQDQITNEFFQAFN